MSAGVVKADDSPPRERGKCRVRLGTNLARTLLLRRA